MKTFKKLSLIAATFGVLTITTPLVLTSCNGDSGDGENPDDGGGGSGNPGGGNQTQKYNVSLSSHQKNVTLSSNSVAEGEEVSLTWKGNSDAIVSYSYKDENGTKIEINNNKFVMPNYNVTIDVVVKYKLTASYDDTKGKLYINNQILNNNSSIELLENSNVTYKVETNKGYKLKTISGKYSDGSALTINTNNFTFGSLKLTLSIEFEEETTTDPTPPVSTYNINVEDNYKDRVELSKSTASENEEVTLTWKGDSNAIVEFYYLDGSKNKVGIKDNKLVMPNFDVLIKLTIKYKAKLEITNGTFYDATTDQNIPTDILLELNNPFNYKIEPDSGYELKSFEVYKDNNKIESLSTDLTGSYTLTIESNITFKIVCEEIYKNHSITLNSHQQDIELSKPEAKMGEEVTLKWTGNTDAKVTYYLIDKNNTKTEIKDNKFVMPDNQVSIDVKVEYKVTIELNEGGTLSINNTNYVNGSSFYVEENSTISYEITPEKDKKVNKIIINQNNKDNPLDKDKLINTYTLSADGNITFKVEFGKTTSAIVKDVKEILVNAMQVFDLYKIIPESFKEQNLADKDGNKTNITADSYKDSFMNVSEVPVYGMGAQLRQFLNASEMILQTIDASKPIYDIASTIGQLWQDFFNKDPDNGTNYEASTSNDNVKFKISLTDTEFRIMLKGYSANIDITKNLNTNETTTRMQINNANSMKIVQSESRVQIGLRAFGAQRMMLDFDLSNKDETIGTLYNFYGKDGEDNTSDLGITTMSVIKITDDYVSVIGKKGDFLKPDPDNRNVEMYDTKTGKFIGSQVLEKAYLGNNMYNTNWYPLSSIAGLNNFKIVSFSTTATTNGEKYINDSQKEFDNGRSTIMGVPTGSRQYEFEQKTVYVYKTVDGKIQEQKIKIPLFFMQDEYEKDTSKGFAELSNKNKPNNLSNSISNTTLDRRDQDSKYLKEKYEQLILDDDKNQQVIDFIGTADSWFDSTN